MSERLDISGLAVDVRRSERRKTLSLTVDRAGDVVLHAPSETPEADLRKWVNTKLLWVHQKLAKKQALVRDVHPPEFVSGESIFYLGRSYRLRVVEESDEPLRLAGEWFELARRALPNAAEHFKRWYIQNGAAWLRDRSSDLQRLSGQSALGVVVGDLGFRWGSCGRNGTLYFNWRLLQLPVRIVDYVVLHEQVHLLHHNHSPAFWEALERVLPDWRSRRDELETEWGRYAKFALAVTTDGSRPAVSIATSGSEGVK